MLKEECNLCKYKAQGPHKNICFNSSPLLQEFYLTPKNAIIVEPIGPTLFFIAC
jgi:hypothetical protein